MTDEEIKSLIEEVVDEKLDKINAVRCIKGLCKSIMRLGEHSVGLNRAIILGQIDEVNARLEVAGFKFPYEKFDLNSESINRMCVKIITFIDGGDK